MSDGIQERIASHRPPRRVNAPQKSSGTSAALNERSTPRGPTPRNVQALAALANAQEFSPRCPSATGQSEAPLAAGTTVMSDGTIQERMRWHGSRRLAKTVAVRVDHTPSHYAMLGVPRDFTQAQLKKQYRLLALRYHPDTAMRNGIDPVAAEERFKNLQAAYEVLGDPARKQQYDREVRLQQLREWRRARSTDLMMLQMGKPSAMEAWGVTEAVKGSTDGGTIGEGATGGGGEDGVADDSTSETAEARVQQAEESARVHALQADEQVEWLTKELEVMKLKLQAMHEMRQAGELARREAEEAMQRRAEEKRREAEEDRARQRALEKARRQQEKLRREAEESARREAQNAARLEAEAAAASVEERVRKQVEARAQRQGAEQARREADERVRAVEEQATKAVQEAEAKASRLQIEMEAMQQKLAEQEAARVVSNENVDVGLHTTEEEEMEEEAALERALRCVVEATRQEREELEWKRRAVKATGTFPELPDPSSAAPSASPASSATTRWVCITVPAEGEQVVMDTPHGRFAVLVPSGVLPGNPLLVPLPATEALRAATSDATATARQAAREAQLKSLMELGFEAQVAAPYCDGVSSTDALVELIAGDHAVLDAVAECGGEAGAIKTVLSTQSTQSRHCALM
mmetsp:Transcript_55576/g.92055  ORF Transcript_55576/g.92055 Transcript_55576/m.92055 type:complete len:639 (+) Transcript_55576:44-1960(+)